MLESSGAALGSPRLGVGERRGGNLTSAEGFRPWHSWAMSELAPIAAAAAALLVQSRQTVAVSESSAGGLISAALLAIPGASAYFQGGGVIYTQNARRTLLGIADESVKGIRSSTEAYALLGARTVREKLGTTWGLAETGASGATGNR